MSENKFIETLCERMTDETAQLVIAMATDIQEQLGLSRGQRDYIARATGDLVSNVVAKTAGLFKELEQEFKRLNP